MSRRLRHRGPDWSGSCIDLERHYALAHERLAIVDPASGKQPLFDPDEVICVSVNGEIYNFEKLRDQLPKEEMSRLKSKSDCAVIPSLLKHFGIAKTACLLDGQFAFVAYDKSSGRTMAARDHMGLCPLYIGWGADGSVVFASELKALLNECVTFKEFPPGHYYDDSQEEFITQWYKPAWLMKSVLPSAPVTDIEAAKVQIRSLLISAVRKRLMADVPFGVLLSGGLDSSIVASILCRELQEASGHNTPPLIGGRVQSFSIGIEGSPDLAAARYTASMLGTEHMEFKFTVEEGISALREMIYYLETYDVTTIRASIPMYLLSKYIRAYGVKFVLSGEGADEVFGGYLYFHRAPGAVEFHEETVRKIRDLHYYDVLRANKSSMAASLEVRVPFLDKDFLEYCMGSVDPALKMCTAKVPGGPKYEKYLLRTAFEGYLPENILWRQKEQFSDGVGYNWIDSLKEFTEKAVSDQQMKNSAAIFPHNTPKTKEAYYYRMIFHQHFPSASAEKCVPGGPSIACSSAAAIAWDPLFAANADQSGRSVIGVHVSTTA